MFKVGDLAVLKTTNETVCVVGFEKDDDYGPRVLVRRARMSKEAGIVHDLNSFYMYELESEQEAYERDIVKTMQDYKKMMRINDMTSVPQVEKKDVAAHIN